MGEADAGATEADGDAVGASDARAAGACEDVADGDGDGLVTTSSAGVSTRRPQANAAFQ